jgi:hypothetical protein
MIRPYLLALALVASTSCISSPSSVSLPPLMSDARPAEGASSPLSQLVNGGDTANNPDQQLQETLRRQIRLTYPIRTGVLFYQYQSALDSPDQQALFRQAQDAFAASGLVRETIQLSNSLVGNNASIETLRQLGARFQTDVLVIVAGNNTFARARNQPLGFFDAFSDRAYYQQTVTLEAVALDVFSGTFLSPLRVVQASEPTLLDPAASDYRTQLYNLRKKTEEAAWTQIQTDLIASLKRQQAQQAEASPAPQPSPAQGVAQ